MSHSLQSRKGLSRRGFIAGASAGSLVLMAKLTNAQEISVANAARSDVDTFDPDLFVSIAPDGIVSILAPKHYRQLLA